MSLGSGLEKDGMHHMVNKTRGIITLYRHQRAAFAITSKRGPAPKAPKTPTTELPPGSTISADNDEVQRLQDKTLLTFIETNWLCLPSFFSVLGFF